MREDKFKNLIEEIWKAEQCEKCRIERKEFADKEKKWHNQYCPIYPGFWYNNPEDPNIPIDILIVTESHGGGPWPEKNTIKNVIKDAYNYHKNDEIKKFFQWNMRKIIKFLDENKKRWFVTDLVKCYVFKDKKNLRTAIEFCKPYLIKQIKFLKPKIILVFGKTWVKPAVEKILNENKDIRCDNIKYYCLPSRASADAWVVDGDYKKVINDIKIKLENGEHN